MVRAVIYEELAAELGVSIPDPLVVDAEPAAELLPAETVVDIEPVTEWLPIVPAEEAPIIVQLPPGVKPSPRPRTQPVNPDLMPPEDAHAHGAAA